MYISPRNEFPRFYGDIQAEHQDWKLGDVLPKGWAEAVEVPAPETNGEDVFTIQEMPVEVDGVLTQQWSTRQLTDDELQIKYAPVTAKAKLIDLGLTAYEIQALTQGLVR